MMRTKLRDERNSVNVTDYNALRYLLILCAILFYATAFNLIICERYVNKIRKGN